MFTSEYFTIDGHKSSDIGVNGCYLVRTESEVTRQLMGQKSVVKDTIRYNNIPYFYTIDKDVISFDLKFSLLEDDYTEDRLFELMSYFAQDHYVEFTSADYPSLIFYVIATSVDLITFGFYKGYYQVHLENCCNFAFSRLGISKFDFSTLTTSQTFEIYAKFNVDHPKCGAYFFPELLIDMKGSATSIILTNVSDGGRTFGFTGLTALESLEINNEKKNILSSTGNSRINNMIGYHNWFRLSRGLNKITVNAPAIIQIKAMYPIYI